jgi:TonB-linked SusC/RagA family outer membrane protein
MTQRRILPMLVVTLLLALQTFAQQRTITGRVTDETGAGLPGVTVTVKGSRAATQTDNDGAYRLNVPENSKTLVFTGIGFATVESAITGSAVNIKLAASQTALNEVVVTGYGTRRVKDVTGSVTRVGEKDFNKGQIASPEQLLQGRAPGVLVTPATGEPGAAATINIRGTSSISGRQEPLFVVDGVPLAQGGTLGSASGVEGGTTAKNPLIFLNPMDIESITVLKDASAAAIYGSRGANGVVLITTKQGRGGKSGQFAFNAQMSYAKTAKRYDLMNASNFLRAAKQANIDGGADPVAAAEAVAQIDKGASTDWQDQIFRETLSQTYNLSWGFNRGGTSARISGSYDDQVGIVRNSGLKRLTARANVSQKLLKDKLRLEANLTYSNTRNQYAPLSDNAGFQGSLLGAALQFNPTYPVYNPDGSFFQPGDQRNPAQMLAYFDDRDYVNRFLGNISASYQITKGLTYKIVLGRDQSTSERTAFADPRLGSGAYGGTINVFGKDYQNGIQGNGRTTRQNLDVTSNLLEQYLTFDRTFADRHNVNVVAGYSYQDFTTEYKGAFGWGLNTPVTKPTEVFNKDYNSFKNYGDFVPNYDNNKLQSVFGRLNYIFSDKYYVTLTVRTDGSSKFGANNRYATFPAVAVKWNIIEEAWAEKALGGLFSNLAIRANWGRLGSQDNLASYAALNLQQTWDVGSGPTTRFIQQGNPDLKWEELTTKGIGFDLTSKNGRFNATVDYYDNTRRNMLFFAPTPGGFAPTSFWWINLPGEVTNKGWEFNIGYKIIEGKKFKWDVSANLTTVKNNITGLPTPINTGAVSGQGLTGAFAQTLTNGAPIFSWSMLQYEGFDGNGNARYGNGGANQLVGTALPNLFGGLTNNFTYGRLSMSVFLNAMSGFYVYNNTANALFLKGSLRNARNVTNEVGNGPENPFNPGSVSTRFLEKGDFIRLANVNLSYMFNVNRKAIKSLSVYASGQNLALWTGYSGIDPEVNVDKNINGVPSRGFDYTQYPRPMILTFGVNVGF